MSLKKKIGQNILSKNDLLKNFVLTTLFSLGIIVILSLLSDLICLVFPQLKPDYGYAPRYPLIVLIIVFALFPAIYEELIFRKLILQFLRKRLPDLTAILLSSLLFAVFHLNILQGVTAFIFGIFLAVVAIRTGSIILCIYAHLLNNLAFILYSLF